MFKMRWVNPYPHVMFTGRGDPYVDVDEVLNSEKGQQLAERMKLIKETTDKNTNGNKSSSEKT